MKLLVPTVFILTLALLAGSVGYINGSRTAPNLADAQKAFDKAYKSAFEKNRQSALETSMKAAFKAGANNGENEGQKNGGKFGYAEGRKAAEQEVARIAAEQAAAQAAAEEAERRANCGAPLFVNGYCPTDAELQYEMDAETYCGGGLYAEAAARGIQC